MSEELPVIICGECGEMVDQYVGGGIAIIKEKKVVRAYCIECLAERFDKFYVDLIIDRNALKVAAMAALGYKTD